MTIVKKLSKAIGLFAISALFSASVFANMADANAKKDEMIKSLNLTPEQQTKVDEIMVKSHDERMAIMKKYENEQGPAKMKAMRPDVEALHQKTQAELAAVLNDEQLNIVEQYQDEMMASAKARMGK